MSRLSRTKNLIRSDAYGRVTLPSAEARTYRVETLPDGVITLSPLKAERDCTEDAESFADRMARMSAEAFLAKHPVQVSCPVRIMDGHNELRCWLPGGHAGDHR